MYLDKVLYDLIVLLSSKKVFNITQLAENIKKSRRIVYYNIDKLNDYLIRNNMPIIENKTGVGVVLNDEQKKAIKSLIKDTQYYFDRDERRLLLALFITTHPDKLNIDKIQEMFILSRNSIISDIKYIKQSIKEFNKDIRIISKPKGGYEVVGQQLILIQYIYFLLKEIMDLKNQKIIEYIKVHYRNIDFVFSEEFEKYWLDILKDLEIKLGKVISLKEIKYLTFTTPFLYLFSKNSKSIEKDLLILRDRLEYKILAEILKNLEKQFSVIITEKFVLLLTLILLCTSKVTDIHTNSDDFILLKKLSQQLLYSFKQETNYDITDEIKAVESLTTYLKVLYFQKKYNIVTRSDLQEFSKKYKYIYETIKKISKNKTIQFNDNDLHNILIHILKFIKKNEKNILIVSAESTAIKQLIKKKILDDLANIKIVELIDKSKLANYDNYDIDLVVTTEYDLQTRFEYIVVKRNIGNEDIVNIYNQLNN